MLPLLSSLVVFSRLLVHRIKGVQIHIRYCTETIGRRFGFGVAPSIGARFLMDIAARHCRRVGMKVGFVEGS